MNNHNSDVFFREATLRLCGHLQIEEGLHDCFSCLATYLPADAIYLERFEPDLGAMRIIAHASPTHHARMDLLVPFSERATNEMARFGQERRDGTLPPVLIFNDPQNPVSNRILRALDEPASSVMSLPLIIEDRLVGAVALLATGSDRFTDEHVRLFASLKEPFFVAMSNTLEHEEVLRLKNRLADDNRYLNRELLRISGDEIIGADFGLREVMRLVRQVAPTDSPVLLTGETGVGKDVIANAIHLASTRRDGPFVPVNCGAIPPALLDSELFGHEKGAFTGALQTKRGRFERADKGTILLDEIGEMPLDAQVRLLRVLQHKETERVGGAERIPVDIRIIAATNRDLLEMVRLGRFREDLWFRLNVFPIAVPPLRERPSDIPALVRFFIERKAQELKIGETPRLAKGAIDALMGYRWPGNVRELENLVERAMILHRGELRFDLSPSRPARSTPAESDLLTLDEVTAQHIERVLEKTGGKIHGPGGAAELLNINPNTLRYRMRKLGIAFGRR